MLDVYSDAASENLYALPRWTADGRQMLSEEIYDGFSVELDRDDTSGFVLIGGSLTNYPAVDGLEPVTLSLPPVEVGLSTTTRDVAVTTEWVGVRHDGTEVPLTPVPSAPPAPAGARADTDLEPQSTQETPPMSEPMEQTQLPGVPDATSAPTVPPALPLPPVNDPALQARLADYLAQNQAYMQQRERQIEASLRADLERQMHELGQRNHIESFARQMTVTTAEQPYALSIPPADLNALLLETPSVVRSKWMTLIGKIVRGEGLVSFDEIGSSGEAAEASDRWNSLINAKIAAGMSRFEAIRAVGREYPDLHNAQQYAKRGGR